MTSLQNTPTAEIAKRVMEPEEQWRPVPGYEGLYEVSDMGRVRSLPRQTNGRWKRASVPGKVLAPALTDRGYRFVGLCREGVVRPGRIHTLVLTAFRGPRTEMQVCRHLNGDKTDNRLANLVWGTQKENGEDQVRLGLSLRGSAGTNARLNAEQVQAIRKSTGAASITARKFGICRQHVLRLRKGESWGWLTDESEPSSQGACK